jgi:hypothetical protein
MGNQESLEVQLPLPFERLPSQAIVVPEPMLVNTGEQGILIKKVRDLFARVSGNLRVGNEVRIAYNWTPLTIASDGTAVQTDNILHYYTMNGIPRISLIEHRNMFNYVVGLFAYYANESLDGENLFNNLLERFGFLDPRVREIFVQVEKYYLARSPEKVTTETNSISILIVRDFPVASLFNFRDDGGSRRILAATYLTDKIEERLKKPLKRDDENT